MTFEQILKNSSFLSYCKEAYFKKIRPANPISRETDEYKKIVELAKLYFENNMEETFSQYMMEGQYFVQLWTAHLILEYGNPNNILREECLAEIVKYTDNPLSRDIENEEKLWLKNHLEYTLYFR